MVESVQIAIRDGNLKVAQRELDELRKIRSAEDYNGKKQGLLTSLQGQIHVENKKFKEALRAYKSAKAMFEKVTEKTDDGENDTDFVFARACINDCQSYIDRIEPILAQQEKDNAETPKPSGNGFTITAGLVLVAAIGAGAWAYKNKN